MCKLNDIEDKIKENLKNMIIGMKKAMNMKAIEFPNDLQWINTSESLTLEKLKGHIYVI